MNPAQTNLLLNLLRNFQKHPYVTNEGKEESVDSFHQKRIRAITEINSLLSDFLHEKISLQEFKESHELLCRKFPYWGFKGFSGQMQLNQFVNNIADEKKESKLRAALLAPQTATEAQRKIDLFCDYILNKRINATSTAAFPRVASVDYVLSYFWEIQNRTLWPVYYNSSKRVLGEIGLTSEAKDTIGGNYLWFVQAMKLIADIFQKEIGAQIPNSFWFVEHVLWRHFLRTEPSNVNRPIERKDPEQLTKPLLANEWLPSIVNDLCELALNRETEWSKRNNLKPEKAFESKIRIAFTLLGYEATELGQGKGRQPDGFAISKGASDGEYAIIYDAKAREKKFSVGTSDREIYEYIKRKTDDLKKERVARNYFLIISSEFDKSQANNSLLLDVYRRTRIPIVLITASDLLFLVEEKLKDVELNHSRLEMLFLENGVLPREKIIEIIGSR
jgi:hypothetical protein